MPEAAKPAVKPVEKKAPKAPSMQELLAQSKKIDANVEKENAKKALAELKAKAGVA